MRIEDCRLRGGGTMRFCLSVCLLQLIPSAVPAFQGPNQQAARQPLSVLQGTLVVAGQGVARLATPTGNFVLKSDSPSLLHTLQDPRLNGRQVQLEGRANADGTFDASHLYTLRDGKLYKLRYYCHVCNIAATEPGPCVCCQRPTDLEEIPLSEVTDDMVTVP